MSNSIIGRFLLYPGELLRLKLPGKLGLRCDCGRMLLTAGREGRDHELYKGDRVVCGGLVLVEGEGELVVEHRLRGRLLFWLTGSGEIEMIGLRSNRMAQTGRTAC
jgi:hypothetical protein